MGFYEWPLASGYLVDPELRQDQHPPFGGYTPPAP